MASVEVRRWLARRWLVRDRGRAVVSGRLAVLGSVAAVALTLSACSQGRPTVQGSRHPPATTAPPLPGGYGLLPAVAGLSDRIVLDSTRIASGQSISGALLVVSHRSPPVNLTTTCRPDFQVVLTSASYTPEVAWAAVCSDRPFTIVPGTNRLALRVITTYLGCRQSGPPSTEPECLASGPPPLPPGNYDAVLVGDGLALPRPHPVPVTLTKSSTSYRYKRPTLSEYTRQEGFQHRPYRKVAVTGRCFTPPTKFA